MTRIQVDIRSLQQHEVGRLEQSITRVPGLHRERLAMQETRVIEYLIAWVGERPVGQVLIKWDGTAREPMATRLKSCPQLSDLFVVEECRSRGIGTQLLHAAEESITLRGYRRVALGVGIENSGARSLYERLGYRDPGFDPYTITYPVIGADGRKSTVTEETIYLVKDLHEPGRELKTD